MSGYNDKPAPHQTSWHPDLKLPPFKNSEKYISVVDKSPNCGILLSQPEWTEIPINILAEGIPLVAWAISISFGLFIASVRMNMGLPKWLSGKEFTCQAGEEDLIPESGRFTGEGKGNPPQYSCLGNLMDRGVWRVTIHGVTKSQTWLSD